MHQLVMQYYSGLQKSCLIKKFQMVFHYLKEELKMCGRRYTNVKNKRKDSFTVVITLEITCAFYSY